VLGVRASPCQRSSGIRFPRAAWSFSSCCELAHRIMLVQLTAYVQRKCELFSHLSAVFVVEVSGAAARAPSRPRVTRSSHFRVCDLDVCEQAGFTSHSDGKRARLTTRPVLCRERAYPGSGLTRATSPCWPGRKVGHKVHLPWSQVRRLRQAGKLAADPMAHLWPVCG
jgi:hypothetical protein